jgi:hypothetical protein
MIAIALLLLSGNTHKPKSSNKKQERDQRIVDLIGL